MHSMELFLSTPFDCKHEGIMIKICILSEVVFFPFFHAAWKTRHNLEHW